MTTPERPTPPNPLARMERLGYGLGALAVIVAGLVWGGRGMVAAAAGSALACANLWLTRRLVDRALREAAAGHGAEAARRLLGGALLKTPLLIALLFVCIVVLHLDVAPFALGLSVLVAAAIIGGLAIALKDKGD